MVQALKDFENTLQVDGIDYNKDGRRQGNIKADSMQLGNRVGG